MAITRDGGARTGQANGTSFTDGPFTIAANDLVVYAMRIGGTISSFSDNIGGVWHQDVAQLLPGGQTLYIYSCLNSPGGASVSITANLATNTSFRYIGQLYTGFGTNGAQLDKVSSAQGTSASPDSGNSGVTSVADEAIIGAIGGTGSATLTAGTGWTIQGTAAPGGNELDLEDQLPGAIGNFDATGTWSASQAWGSAVATYKAFGSGNPVVLNGSGDPRLLINGS